MIKLSLTKNPRKISVPYFYIRTLNQNKLGMKTYNENKIKTEDLYVLKLFLIDILVYNKQIENNTFEEKNIIHKTSDRNGEKYLMHYLKSQSNENIQITEERGNWIPLKIETVTYFDEYQDSYTVDIRYIKDVIKNF
jgi:hypothetical protein